MAGPRLILFAALAIVTVASVRADERRTVKNPHFGQVLYLLVEV